MLVVTQNFAFQGSNATDVDVLTDFSNQSNTFFFELCFQNFNVSDFASNGSVQYFVSKCLETSIFSNEVSLAVNFQNESDVAVDFGFDYAVSSNVACFFAALIAPDLRMFSIASSMSPLASVSAFCNPSCLRQYAHAALLPGMR